MKIDVVQGANVLLATKSDSIFRSVDLQVVDLHYDAIWYFLVLVLEVPNSEVVRNLSDAANSTNESLHLIRSDDVLSTQSVRHESKEGIDLKSDIKKA